MKSAVVRRSHDSLDDDSPAEEALEQGTLAFGTVAKETAWQRPPRPVLRQASANCRQLRFEITSARVIVPPIGLHSGSSPESTKRYVLYTLSVRQDSEIRDPHPAEIERRYTHFRTLYMGLRKLHPELIAGVSFPKKVILGNFGADLISYRSTGFESLLDRVACESRLRECPPTIEFLCGDARWRHDYRGADVKAANRRNATLNNGRKTNHASDPGMTVAALENQFRLLNKVYMDRSRPVLLALLVLVEACTVPHTAESGGATVAPQGNSLTGGAAPDNSGAAAAVTSNSGSVLWPHPRADRWADLALKRFEGVSDADLLAAYIPLLKTCVHLWWQKGRDRAPLERRLAEMSRRGINVDATVTLTQALDGFDFVRTVV